MFVKKLYKTVRAEDAALFALSFLWICVIIQCVFLPGENARSSSAEIAGSLPVLILDPGHGGDDSGAQYEGRLEKDDNLELALAVEKELKARGVKVCMTREDDTFISLAGRCRKANIRRAKLFVALHRNSAENAHGVEIWIHSDSPPKDTALAQNICDALATAGISENCITALLNQGFYKYICT